MKGLTGVLSKFSEGLRIRKILPSLLEEVRYFFSFFDLSYYNYCSIDERHATLAQYSSKCVCDLVYPFPDSVFSHCTSQPKTAIHDKGPTSKHDDSFGQYQTSAG
jgi:hypothetical protein